MDQLLLMGFDGSQAELALRRCSGNVDRAIDLLLSGEPLQAAATATAIGSRSVVQLDISQYSFSDAGASACTVIASAAMKHILERLANNPAAAFDAASLSQVVTDGVQQFTRINGGRGHLAVDELGPAFFGGLRMVDGGILQGLIVDRNAFADLLTQVRQLTPAGFLGAVITKPPETIAIVLPPAGSSSSRHFFFDSHSRPHLGHHGAYLVECSSAADLLVCLQDVFIPIEVDGNDQMNMMYNIYEATVFRA